MKVKRMTEIKIGYGLRQFTDCDTFQVKGKTPKECLEDLIRQVPKIRNWIFDENGLINAALFINGQIAYEEDLRRGLEETDKLTVLDMIDGG